MLTPDQRKELLSLARRSIGEEMRSRHQSPMGHAGKGEGESVAAGAGLDVPGGAFVTLHLDGELRGCIGYVEYPGPLRRAVDEVARKAAFEDPRFPPLTPPELDRMEIEISVLSPLRRIGGSGDVHVGEDGLVVELGRHRGLLLPQVAREYRWDAEQFLENTARKAGLPPGAWRNSAAELFAFTAEVFSEESEKA
ncbi:MAG: AmmeMemoRadiSam system protein A [Bacteroidetes bacterium]|nr:AmmeMemoRadiSam system protein A [Bacteroidota bacterium]